MRKYKIYFTQPERRAVTLLGICKKSDGMNCLTTAGELVTGAKITDQNKQDVWNYKLSSFGEIDGYPDGKKRAFSYIFVPDEHDRALAQTVEEGRNAMKMHNLINYIKTCPDVAHYKFEKGNRVQINPNFDQKLSRGIHYVLIDETALEEEEFDTNRKKRKAMSLLDDVYDQFLKDKNSQPLTDICYGLNTSVKPYAKQPIENYNNLEDFINNSPERFIKFMENKMDSELVVLFRKATKGVAADKGPLITLSNEAYYFNGTVVGKNEEECIYFLKSNPKIKDYLHNALNVRRDINEVKKAEEELSKEVEKAVSEKGDQNEAVSKIIEHSDKWIAKIKKKTHLPAKLEELMAVLKDEVDGYEPDNKEGFKNYFNAAARRNELPMVVEL